jgi:Aerotolerance regulator N-terminal/von Willebrand factor type A domain
MTMNFLYPAFLIGTVLVAIPIVLHLLRRDVAPPVPFTAVRLLRKSPIERTRRRRLRDLLLLAARVAALLLLAAAFARPYFASDTSSAAITIVAIDRSFSMGAPGQFDRAIALARAAVDDAGASAKVAVIAFDERADVIAPPGGASDARLALAELRPSYGGTRYATALHKAAEVADGAPGALILVTDLQRAGWEEDGRGLLPESLQLRIADAGTPPPNVAVTAVRLDADRIVASIRNAAPRERSGDVRAVRDGRVLASARFTAAADSFVDVPIAVTGPADGSLVIEVDDASGFEADNARFVMLNPVPRPAALIVTSGMDSTAGFYLARAMEAAASADANDSFEPKIVSGAQASGMAAEALSRYRAIVLLSTRGLDRRARAPIAAFVRGGGGLLIAASPDVEEAVVSTMFDWPPARSAAEQRLKGTLSVTDLRHPIFQPFGALAANLGNVRFERSWRLKSDAWEVAARFTDGSPALVERSEGKGRVVLFASDLDRRWNDFPLHPSFVPFAVETLHYVSGIRVDVREYVVGRVPDGVRAAPGVYPFANRTVAVNVDPRESATARLSDQEFHDMIDRVAQRPAGPTDARAVQAEARQSYWQYALALMLGVLVVESVIGKP